MKNRDMVDAIRNVIDEQREEITALKAENVKLRELVTDMCEWAYIDSYCDLRQEFADRMRELGVEVDDG